VLGKQILISVFSELLLKVKNDLFSFFGLKCFGLNEAKKPEVELGILNFF
jgi:hypothetical protein